MVKIRANIGKKITKGFTRPEGAGNFDNMDDNNVVRSINIKFGTVQDVNEAKGVVNREYVDSADNLKLDLDGSNANQNIDISPYTFFAGALGASDIGIGITDGTIETNTLDLTLKPIVLKKVIIGGDGNLTVNNDLIVSNDATITDTLTINHDLIIDHTATTDTDQIIDTITIGGGKLFSSRTGAGVPVYALGRSQGTTASRSYPVANDDLGRIDFYGWNTASSSWKLTADIRAYATANWGVGTTKTGLKFYVTTTGTKVLGMTLDENKVLQTAGGYKSTDGSAGITATITTAKLTAGGANGSMTFKNGLLTAQTAST